MGRMVENAMLVWCVCYTGTAPTVVASHPTGTCILYNYPNYPSKGRVVLANFSISRGFCGTKLALQSWWGRRRTDRAVFQLGPRCTAGRNVFWGALGELLWCWRCERLLLAGTTVKYRTQQHEAVPVNEISINMSITCHETGTVPICFWRRSEGQTCPPASVGHAATAHRWFCQLCDLYYFYILDWKLQFSEANWPSSAGPKTELLSNQQLFFFHIHSSSVGLTADNHCNAVQKNGPQQMLHTFYSYEAFCSMLAFKQDEMLTRWKHANILFDHIWYVC